MTPEQIDAWRRNIRNDTLANYHLHMGLALDRDGAADAAVAAFRRALDAKPDCFEAHVSLVRLLNRMEQVGLAREVDRTAKAENAAYDVIGNVRLGKIALEQERLDVARDCARLAVEIDPSHRAGQFLMWLIDTMRGESRQPLKAGADEPEVQPLVEYAEAVAKRAMALRNYTIAEPLIQFLHSCGATPENLEHLGTLDQWRLRLTTAADLLNEALAMKPKDFNISLNLVRTNIALGRHEAAERPLHDVMQIDGKSLVVILHRCQLELARQRPDIVLALCDEAGAENDRRPFILGTRGLALVQLGRTAEAESCLREALVSPGLRLWTLLDGAVGLAKLGLEAQSLEAWRQVGEHKLPHTPFLTLTRRWVGADVLRTFGIDETAIS